MTVATFTAETKLKEFAAYEQNRIQQQGLGKPIVSTDLNGHKFVAVGNTIHHSKKWAYFSDFLFSYIKKKLGEEWGNNETRKQFRKRHPLMQWYHQVGELQRQAEKNVTGHYNFKPTGLTHCYFGLAYNLYLLEHNVELQALYIERLKRIDQFQGAYYELIVASCIIRAGFDLQLEDETDQTQKHCEFSALSKLTGNRYWVEAKMRSVSGLLGKTKIDGQPKTSKPTSQLSKHLRDALKKPAEGARIVFIDVNTSLMAADDFAGTTPKDPKWLVAAEKQLGDREKNLSSEEQAYVFVTNFGYHHALKDTFLGTAALPFGLGMDDFGKPQRTFKDVWRAKRKHRDLHAIKKALMAKK
ncbi:MAG: hypothetical protein KUG61_01440, partial [Parvibaculaceae bacterium]|nr:hypothetical protein [Parvibaculaceae bacterium]